MFGKGTVDCVELWLCVFRGKKDAEELAEYLASKVYKCRRRDPGIRTALFSFMENYCA